jgi:predicted DNA-binding ribbon-helix-helix protein
MKSLIRKHALVINGRKTSISIEDEFWEPLQEIAAARGTSVANVISLIDAHHQGTNLSSAIRLTVLEFYRDQKLPSWISSSRHQ